MSKPRTRLGVFALGVWSLSVAAALGFHLSYVGFPDGALTDLERTQVLVWRPIVALLVLQGGALLGLGWADPKKLVRHLRFGGVTHAGLLLALAVTEVYLRYVLGLDNGGGG